MYSFRGREVPPKNHSGPCVFEQWHIFHSNFHGNHFRKMLKNPGILVGVTGSVHEAWHQVVIDKVAAWLCCVLPDLKDTSCTHKGSQFGIGKTRRWIYESGDKAGIIHSPPCCEPGHGPLLGTGDTVSAIAMKPHIQQTRYVEMRITHAPTWLTNKDPIE